MIHPRLFAALAVLLLLLVGCEQTTVIEQEQIAQRETVLALTPSATPTVTATFTPSATPTSSPTTGPSPSPTASATATSTPLPPTPTSNPALQGFSYCTQQVGDANGGRYSAQLTGITANSFPAFERITFTFTNTVGVAPLSAVADCLSESDFIARTGQPASTRPYLLEVHLPDWLHDEQFESSAITNTYELSGTRVLTHVDLRYNPASDAGLTFSIPISEPLRFHLTLMHDPERLVLETAKAVELVEASDPLTAPLSSKAPDFDAPLYFLQEGDIWQYQDGKASNLTETVQEEIAFAVSPDGSKIAFCRATTADASYGDAAGPSSLFVMNADGSNAKEIGRTGLGCADPAWSVDSKQIAWSVDESGILPTQRTIWSIAASGGAPERRAGGIDEWNRYAPQWLEDGKLVYSADTQDGRSTLFLLEEDAENDIGAAFTLSDRYISLGRPLADKEGKQFAVEAQRGRNPGSDLLILDAQGEEIEIMSDGYWTRALGWRDDGGLLFLSNDCISTLVQSYSLGVLNSGKKELFASGTSLIAINAAAMHGDQIAYVIGKQPAAGERGPLTIVPNSSSELWIWDLANGERASSYKADRAISDLQQ